MKIIAITAILLASSTAFAADTSVRGYVKRDGTYVEPSHRTTPNSNPYDNYSTRGNTNPYTGQQGTVDPYRQSAPSYPSMPTIRPLEPLQPLGGTRR